VVAFSKLHQQIVMMKQSTVEEQALNSISTPPKVHSYFNRTREIQWQASLKENSQHSMKSWDFRRSNSWVTGRNLQNHKPILR
jgi:hypothetical protein